MTATWHLAWRANLRVPLRSFPDLLAILGNGVLPYTVRLSAYNMGASNAFLNGVLKGLPIMSDPRDRPVSGGARWPGPLNEYSFRRSRSHGLTGPSRGTVVVAQAPKSKKVAKPHTAPTVVGREISVFGSFDNPWKNQADEADAMAHDSWEPTSDDFQAVAGNSGVKVTSWKGLMQVVLTNGDAESAAGSISRVNIFTHAELEPDSLGRPRESQPTRHLR